MTAAQLRDVVARITASGQWEDGDPDILVVLDAGYDLTRLAWLLADLPLEILGRLRSDRVIHCPAPALPARLLAADVRLPWQQPCRPGRLTPAHVRRGYRSIRQKLPIMILKS